MNPIVFWRIIAGVAALFGVGGAAYGYDQRKKRQQEQTRFRAEIAALEARIAGKELEYAALWTRLGEKNAQVRSLAHEIQNLRGELANLRRRASA